jgi:AraC-like DNA-binding protein
MRAPPSLGELAAAAGLTEKRLNAGFRALFGATVFETLRNERLEHARLVLDSEDVTLKAIAFRVGYNHVTNFINAFAARYGAPPRQYRRDSSDALTPTPRRLPTSPLCIANVAEEVSSGRGMPRPLAGRPTDHPLMLFVWQRTIAWEPGQRPSRHAPEQLPGLAPEHARQGHTDYGTPSHVCRH